MKSEKFSFDLLTYSVWGGVALTFLSGIFLTVHYIPAFAQAFPSLQRVNEQVAFGWTFRRLHAAGGSFLLLLLIIHLLRVFYTGAYKTRPGSIWVMEVLLVIFAWWTNFVGSFLPLSQEAFWGTAATLSSLSTIPWIGNFLVEFLRGGKELGGVALARFFSMHIGFAALIALLLFNHYRIGIPENQGKKNLFTLNLWATAVVAALLFSVITFAPHWFADPLKESANPTITPEVISSPWYFLFLQETLSYFNATYPLLSFFLWAAILLLLLALPYLDRNPEKSFLLRPIPLSAGSALVAVVVYFTLLGMAGAHYGGKVILPKDQLSAAEMRGARVFAQKNCAYCHQVMGQGGRREGPDMAVVLQRNRPAEWVQRFILNARLYQPGTTMPRYEIPLEDLEGLSAYLLSLDLKKRKFQTIDRGLLSDYEPSMDSPERK
jgi:ubiquinol-cytochrome c reductase cytochrome b subunit